MKVHRPTITDFTNAQHSHLSASQGGTQGAGYSGASGYSGIVGASGYSGKSGYSGIVGVSGISGYSGKSGATGSSGFSGIGISGASGASGASGYSGRSGTSGYSGLVGTSGFSGATGLSGLSGYSGKSGIGTSGFSGMSGTAAGGYTGAARIYLTGYFMPAFWALSNSQATPFKDIGGNACLQGNHDSMDFVFPRPIFASNGIWNAYHWEWVHRTSINASPPNAIYQVDSVESVIGEQGDYIFLKKDIFNLLGYMWSPWKKLSKINWGVNDPIAQSEIEYAALDANYCSEGTIGGAYVSGTDTWTITEVLTTLTNTFWDGTSKIWNGTILHLVENEPPDGAPGDYWLLLGKGLIRIRLTTLQGYIWMESGAY
jgi:hypothetical protein